MTAPFRAPLPVDRTALEDYRERQQRRNAPPPRSFMDVMREARERAEAVRQMERRDMVSRSGSARDVTSRAEGDGPAAGSFESLFESAPYMAKHVGRIPLDFTPGVGDALALNDARVNIDEGNYGSALVDVASTLPVVGIAGDVARKVRKGSKGEKVASKAAKANQGTASVATSFDGMDAKQAMKHAQAGGHLRQTPDGQYVGLPRGVDSGAKLGAMRRQVDQKVEDGLFNADWYQRSRDAIGDASGFSPSVNPLSREAEKARLLANGGAAYSPQATPAVETNAFLKQHDAKTVQNRRSTPRTGSQSRNVDNAYAWNDDAAQFEFNGDGIRLGKKTGPYATAKDPTVPEDDIYQTANDIWHARVFGYRNNDGSAFSRGMTPQEHGALTGENLLVAARAEARGLQPLGASPNFRWTPRSAQAATWGAEREAAKKAEQAAAMVKYEKALAKFERAKAKGKKGLKRPAKPAQMTDEEIRAYASFGVDNALNDLETAITAEFVPGTGTGTLEGMGDLPQSVRDEFSQKMFEARGPRNPVLDAMDGYQAPAKQARGTWTDAETGQVHGEISDVARPIAGRQSGPSGRGLVDPAGLARTRLAAGVDAVTRGQQGVGVHSFTKSASGWNYADKTGARVTGTPAQREALQRALEAEGMDVVDVGDALYVGKGQFGATADNPVVGSKDVQTRIQAIVGRAPGMDDVRVDVGNWQSQLETPKFGAEGSGQASQYLHDLLTNDNVFGAPRRLDAAGVPQALQRQFDTANEFGAQYGLRNRPDVEKLQELLGARGGFQTFIDYVRQYGVQGLPAAAIMAGGAGATRYSRQEERP